MIPLPPRRLGIAATRASLAAELAAQLLPVPDVLQRYDMTSEELRTLLRDPQFSHMVQDYRREWHSPLSARQRVRVKASLAVEDGLTELHRLFYDGEVSPTARLEAYKQLVGLADMGPRKEESGGGATFSLTLNLGGETRQVTIDQEKDTGEKDSIEVNIGEKDIVDDDDVLSGLIEPDMDDAVLLDGVLDEDTALDGDTVEQKKGKVLAW